MKLIFSLTSTRQCLQRTFVCITNVNAACLIIAALFIMCFADRLRQIFAPESRFIRIEPESESPLIILDWTWVYNEPIASHKPLRPCPQLDCLVTADRNLLTRAAAVVFHIRDFSWLDVPALRWKWQRYIFLNMEPPVMTYNDLKTLGDFFNWTMTYRRDSDVWAPYGTFDSHNENFDPIFWRTIWKRKKKLVAWFVSNCHAESAREKYVQELQKYLNVDIFGRCGTKSCPRTRENSCLEMLRDDYKFYLGLENSVCLDYASEKFFHKLEQLVIPIVMSRKVLSPLAPEKSFIAIDDFRSPKDLGTYLQHLETNFSAYLEHQKWREKFKFKHCDSKSTGPISCGFCLLCKMLKNSSALPEKSWQDLHKWWYTDANCQINYGQKLISQI